MVLLETADSAVGVAALIAERTPETLSGTARRLYVALVAAAIETGRGRGYSTHTTHVTMHVPLEIVAKACGISRFTVWRHLPQLKDLGLIDYRTHKGACRGKTHNTGTLWQVRLNPAAGSKCRLSYDDLKFKWRDLDRDVRAGRTSYAALKHTTALEADLVDIKSILAWTLPPETSQIPVTSVCCKPRQVSLEMLLDVKYAPREERSNMVALAAEALSQALSDGGSASFYQKLLWQLLRRFDATGEDYSYQVYLMAQRAKTDVVEGFSRRGGAVFVSRLKQADFYEWVMNAPPVRVGIRPN